MKDDYGCHFDNDFSLILAGDSALYESAKGRKSAFFLCVKGRSPSSTPGSWALLPWDNDLEDMMMQYLTARVHYQSRNAMHFLYCTHDEKP